MPSAYRVSVFSNRQPARFDNRSLGHHRDLFPALQFSGCEPVPQCDNGRALYRASGTESTRLADLFSDILKGAPSATSAPPRRPQRGPTDRAAASPELGEALGLDPDGVVPSPPQTPTMILTRDRPGGGPPPQGGTPNGRVARTSIFRGSRAA